MNLPTLKKRGKGSFELSSPVRIEAAASAAGPFEKKGRLRGAFDLTFDDPYLGEKTWEKAEGSLARRTVARLYEKSSLSPAETDFFFAGDLERQCMASTQGLLPYDVPYCGLYGACSTFGEGLILASALLDGGFGRAAGVITTSHFSTAEREYRTPLVYGKQRQPSAQHTVTGGGAVLLSAGPAPDGEPYAAVTRFRVGRMRDMGITDPGNMGAAMAPAAAETLTGFLEDFGRKADDYDLILTGDLGQVGYEIVRDLTGAMGFPLGGVYDDCGRLLYHEEQDAHAGGSGAGCSSLVFVASVLPRLLRGELKRVLLAPTGALLSAVSLLQGESIPGICHLIEVEARSGKEDF